MILAEFKPALVIRQAARGSIVNKSLARGLRHKKRILRFAKYILLTDNTFIYCVGFGTSSGTWIWYKHSDEIIVKWSMQRQLYEVLQFLLHNGLLQWSLSAECSREPISKD